MTKTPPPSIGAQVAEAKRQLAMMRIIYPQWLAANTIDENAAAVDVEIMEAVVDTLEWLKTYEGAVKAAIARAQEQPEHAEAAAS